MAGGHVVGYNSERGPPKDHPCQVWFKLAQWFQRRRLKCEIVNDFDGHTDAPMLATMFPVGGHLGSDADMLDTKFSPKRGPPIGTIVIKLLSSHIV